MKDHEGALGYLAHARAVAPDDASIHFLFGIVCVEMDLVGEAYDSLKKAVTLAPDNPQVNYVMGTVAMHRHEPAESLPYFEKYIALMPNDPRGRFALGVARFTSGMLTEAKGDLTASVAHPETAAGSHYFLGRIARQENDLETAQREVSAALKLAPDLADGWAELGLIQTRLAMSLRPSDR
jgi:cytochrome c-type biogenesis protein CcmH/NrfG